MRGRFKVAGVFLILAGMAVGIWMFVSGTFPKSSGTLDSTEVSNSLGEVVSPAEGDSTDNSDRTNTFMQSSTIFKAHAILPGVWDITDGTPEKPEYVDIFLVTGTERALVIDAGGSGEDLAGFVKTLTDKPVDLVLTHGHGDHVAAAGQFDKVFLSSKDFDLIRPYTPYDDFHSSGILDLKGGEVFDLGGCKLEVLALPGHTKGSMVLLDRERQLLFAGDAMGSGSLWMQLAESTSVEEFRDEMRKLEKSLEGLNDLKPYLGHYCLMGTKPDKNYIADTRITAEKIVSGELVGTPSGRADFPGSVTTSQGEMTDFLYRPEKILKKGK